MPPWSVPAVVAAALVAAHYLAVRAASGRIGDGLGALALEGSATIGILVLVVLRATPGAATTTAGLFWSIFAGLCISGASTLLFTALRLGGPVSATGTIVLGGGVALSALAAPVLFAEAWTLRRVLGVGLGLAALVVLATDR
jgi:multidrug transporter EmrE-like cation transporter